MGFAGLKTERSARRLTLPAPTVVALQAHRDAQDKERAALGAAWADNDLVFASTIGTPIEPRNLNRQWSELREWSGLPWLRLHDLRHACATFLRASGNHMRHVMEWLGHSQIGLTMNPYAHVLDPAMDTAAARLGELPFGEDGYRCWLHSPLPSGCW